MTTITIADGFIDYITFEDECERFKDLSLRALMSQRKIINEMKSNIEEYNQGYLTQAQTEARQKLTDELNKDYPVEDVTDIEKEANVIRRKAEGNLFRRIAFKNNKLYIEKCAEFNVVLDKLIKEKTTFDAKKYMNERVLCPCGSFSIRKNLTTHRNSKLHKKRLAILTNEECKDIN